MEHLHDEEDLDDSNNNNVSETDPDEAIRDSETLDNLYVLQRVRENTSTAAMYTIVQQLARELQKSESTIKRYLRCVAERCHNGEMEVMEQLAKYISSVPDTLQTRVFIHQQLYDETQHKLRGSLLKKEMLSLRLAKSS